MKEGRNSVRVITLIACLVGAAVVTASALLIAPIGAPSASAEPCSDVEVVFARGTNEPPGVGRIGQAFVDALRAQAGAKSVGVYAVNYPASIEFAAAVDGIDDASAHVQDMAAKCPKTRMVLGGFSQGAAVIGFVTADVVPDGVVASDVPRPMPPSVADHVAAVALFGKPSNRIMSAIGQPPIAIGPRYAAKTSIVCAPDDPVCSDGGDWAAHSTYATDAMVNQAATFAAGRL
ncbi:MAG: cutinase [Mycobacterium sp.]|nr:cutinase [Mycobacterium sp.]